MTEINGHKLTDTAPQPEPGSFLDTLNESIKDPLNGLRVTTFTENGEHVGYVAVRADTKPFIGIDGAVQDMPYNIVEARIKGSDTGYSREVSRNMPLAGLRTRVAQIMLDKKVQSLLPEASRYNPNDLRYLVISHPFTGVHTDSPYFDRP